MYPFTVGDKIFTKTFKFEGILLDGTLLGGCEAESAAVFNVK